MAQRVQVLLIDDIDGGTANETVTFALDGVTYEIDLSSSHSGELREALGWWVSKARKVAARATRSRGQASSTNSDTPAVRAWARAQGYPISDRGRIPGNIRQAYEAAH